MAIREELTLGIRNFQANLDRARADVRRTTGEMSRDMRSVGGGPGGGMLGGMGSGIMGLGRGALGALGMTAGVAGLGVAIKGALTAADDLADLTLALNESAEGLQRVDFAAQQAASIGVDQVAKSMMRLERSLGDVENVKAAEALERLGLSASTLAGMSLEEKILALSAAFQKARVEGTGMADIQDLLGRSAADLVPLFAQSEDALRSLFERAPVMAEETVQEMARINDQIDEMIKKTKTFFASTVGEAMITLGYVYDIATYGREEADKMWHERELADIGAAMDREEARKTQAENMKKAAEAAATAKKESDEMAEADKAEEEILRDRKRREAEVARARESYEAASFARLDPEEQMKTLRDRIAKSLGLENFTSVAEAEARAAELAGQGRYVSANAALSDLEQLEAIAGRQGGPRAVTNANQGSLATLMDEIFGRNPAAEQLEEARRAAAAGEKASVILDKILIKMDEPPPRDVFTDTSF
jgi:hypothetical protein